MSEGINYPITAIGASSGGIDPIIEILKDLPPDTGMSFVIVMHLDRDHKSNLPAIIRRASKMNVDFARNNVIPQQNNIYIIPPGKTLTFKNEKFVIKPRAKSDKVHMSIDYFMRSLAEDIHNNAIGIILSGSNSDGVIGVGEIKSNGGVTFAQSLDTAGSKQMPLAAINSGFVDFVLNPDKIAEELVRISRLPYIKAFRSKENEVINDHNELNKIFRLLAKVTGIDFKEYKLNTIKRRILRRMIVNKITAFSDYVEMIQKNPEEVHDLYEDILINVTGFFRDHEMYNSLKRSVLPVILKNKAKNAPVRIWSTGCSTGEEAYSLAMLVAEMLGPKINRTVIQIFATDLSNKGLEKARSGFYSEDIAGDVSPERLQKFFTKVDGKYKINKSIRDMCVFAKHNVTQDPPFSGIDLITCRNLLIYLGQTLQDKVFPVFHYSLKPKGYLVLGSSESISRNNDMFSVVDKKFRIFKKKNILVKPSFDFYSPVKRFGSVINSSYNGNGNGKSIRSLDSNEDGISDFQKEVDSLILNRFSPAGVVINKNLEVVQFRGRTSDFLENHQGTASLNLLKMAKPNLVHNLSKAVNKCFRSNSPVTIDSIKHNINGGYKELNIIVTPVNIKNESTEMYLVLFDDSRPVKQSGNGAITKIKDESEVFGSETEELRKELEATKEYLQSMIEQYETTVEELTSANEEIQSSNEELQSTNEELETTKEELQSTNEELTTVNEELKNRYNEISSISNIVSNLLSSINIPIIILDSDMKIMRYTNMAENVINLIPSDIGRKLTDLNTNLDITNLESILQKVMSNPESVEFESRDKKGNYYLIRMRPYKTVENRIEGVIIAFIDITELKKNVEQLESSRNEIQELNKKLSTKVDEKTSDLKKANKILEAEIAERKMIEKSLRVLSKHLVDSQESERMKLSRELHDGINQILSAVQFRVQSVEEKLSKKTAPEKIKEIHSDIAVAKELLKKTILEVRTMSANLRPATLDELGIAETIKSIIAEFHRRTGKNVKTSIPKMKKRLSPEIELSLYRIIQESLHNIEKHSKARSVSITLEVINNTVFLTIKDNGKGFTKKDTIRKPGQQTKFGLINMRERVESIGGTIQFDSSSTGTSVAIKIPAAYTAGKNKKKV
jgi:two-component system CheB/CheR fusion protein